MQKKSRKPWVILGVVIALIICVLAIWWETNHGNRQLIDTKYRFSRAIIRLPNGEVVDGKVTSWLDYDDSDVVQIKIDGVTYLTHYSNVCLIDE